MNRYSLEHLQSQDKQSEEKEENLNTDDDDDKYIEDEYKDKINANLP